MNLNVEDKSYLEEAVTQFCLDVGELPANIEVLLEALRNPESQITWEIKND